MSKLTGRPPWRAMGGCALGECFDEDGHLGGLELVHGVSGAALVAPPPPRLSARMVLAGQAGAGHWALGYSMLFLRCGHAYGMGSGAVPRLASRPLHCLALAAGLHRWAMAFESLRGRASERVGRGCFSELSGCCLAGLLWFK